jgi:hypothetical protein
LHDEIPATLNSPLSPVMRFDRSNLLHHLLFRSIKKEKSTLIFLFIMKIIVCSGSFSWKIITILVQKKEKLKDTVHISLMKDIKILNLQLHYNT